MIISLIKLSIKFFLKTYCQRIKIKRIVIELKKIIFKGKVDKIIIEAEKIIYKDIHLNYAKILGHNLNIAFNRNRQLLDIKDFNAKVILHITKEDLKNIINNKKWNEINIKIREFSFENKNIEYISFEKDLIYFNFSKKDQNEKIGFKVNSENNKLILNHISSKKDLLIEFDQNIIFKNIILFKDYLKVELTSKVITNV